MYANEGVCVLGRDKVDGSLLMFFTLSGCRRKIRCVTETELFLTLRRIVTSFGEITMSLRCLFCFYYFPLGFFFSIKVNLIFFFAFQFVFLKFDFNTGVIILSYFRALDKEWGKVWRHKESLKIQNCMTRPVFSFT